LCQE